jgi:hypothetical protein
MNAKCSIHLRNNLAYKEKGKVGGYIEKLQLLHGKQYHFYFAKKI